LLPLIPHTVHPAFEDGTDTGFRNVGQLQFDAGKYPKENIQHRYKFCSVVAACVSGYGVCTECCVACGVVYWQIVTPEDTIPLNYPVWTLSQYSALVQIDTVN